MELTVSSLKRDLAHQTIGKERAALFRHYRVVARKQGPDVLRPVKRDNVHSVPVFHPDNGRWGPLTTMRANQFHEIIRDAELANAIGPIVRKHRLSIEQTVVVLQKSGVARAENVAQIAFIGLPAIASSKLWKEWIDMPTYIYETTDTTKPRREFFVKQSVHDDPLQADPETGEPARRIISAGYQRVGPGRIEGSIGRIGWLIS
jgi:predicted nucleic acid-binding Zn ribbon protein